MSNLVPTNIDQDKVLAAIGLSRNDPKAQAVVLVCQRYDLDPLLKHIQLISTKQGPQLYVSRDGFLRAAHASGVFDGMEVTEESETETHVRVKVAVYRKDMSRPFVATGRFRKGGERTNDDRDPWDMALARAERRALKRAFDMGGIPDSAGAGEWEEEPDLYDAQTGKVEPVAEIATPASPPAFEEPALPDEIEDADTEDAPAVDYITTAQMGKLHVSFADAGIESRDDKLAYAVKVIGREIQSSKEMTKREASAVIEALIAEVTPTGDEQ